MSVKIGQTLKNGAKVVAAGYRANDDLTIVLCQWGDELVTWHYSPETGGCSLGHYFNPRFQQNWLNRAIDDFAKRLK